MSLHVLAKFTLFHVKRTRKITFNFWYKKDDECGRATVKSFGIRARNIRHHCCESLRNICQQNLVTFLRVKSKKVKTHQW